ncbi:hypothetical protein OHB41_07765 [Streptomyces sp. NBC_01571]|uniref:hypothetical protein n=1 Tax=Streptomyces sp. NBC_01571 TaxID=2975883 RepID=UPI00224F337A|nr:hypothetical protein [Streptomyces sp. NBC_01571]MCX4573082.1 hypothetical protein [Streptomyces sp. NBC_01571]
MGVRLIVEILDHWQDVGLTPGERGDLIVLAENANDSSRETWGAVHAPHILKRAGKTAPSWRISVNRLMKKKALEFAKRDGKEVRGYTGQHAVYRLVELCPDPPHSGYKGHCTKPVAGSSEDLANGDRGPDGTSVEDSPPSPEEGYPSANAVGEDPEEGYLTANPEGYLTANAVDGLGYLTATERVSGQLTPTPLVSSFDLSSKDSPSSSAAEESGDVTDTVTTEEGGGGGNLSSSEDQEQDKPIARAESFVDSLDYRGKQPGQTRRAKLSMRVVAAFKDGWTESGLRRYLDISDDPTVRSPASVYLHRLSDEELPDAAVGVSQQLPPACWDCLGRNPAAATDLALRVNPITCDPCTNCHPAATEQAAEVPDACQPCLEENPAARTNVRMRYRIIDGTHQACPDCNPKRIAILAAQNGQQDGADGGMWDRAMDRAQQRMQTGQTLTGTDAKVAGWMAISRQLAAEEKRPKLGRNYDNSVWRQPADPVKAAKIPHCGNPNCDPVTRLKTEPDWTGEEHTAICGKCHPAMQI